MQKVIKLKSDEEALKLFGNLDEHITFAEETFDVRIHARAQKVTLIGAQKNIKHADVFLHNVLRAIRRGEAITSDQLDFYTAKTSHAQKRSIDAHAEEGTVFSTFRGQRIGARTEGQEKYITAAGQHDIIFCIGPAGTGRSDLPVAIALGLLKA